MTTKRRRRFTADFKKRVALKALRGDRTVQAIAAKHEVHPNQVGTWKRQAIEGLDEVFARGGSPGPSEHEATIRDLHAKIGELPERRRSRDRRPGPDPDAGAQPGRAHGADADARTVSTAAATSLWGSASRCVTMAFCGPSTGRTRSHGLSALRSIAMAHASTDRMRRRPARAVSALTCQIGARISSNVGHVDLGDRPAADTWEGVAFEALPPVPRVPPAAPVTALLFKPALGGVGEGGNTLDAALVGQRVRRTTPASGWRGLLAGFGERDERGGAETEFAASSADDEPLDPAAGAGRLHEQVQPVAVSVPSWRGGTDEGGRERLVGMPAAALGSAGCDGDLDYDLRTPVEHQ